MGPMEEALEAQEQTCEPFGEGGKHLPQQTYANERSRMRSSTTIVGCARRDDPWTDDGDLLTAASLRMDLRVSLRGPYWGPRPDEKARHAVEGGASVTARRDDVRVSLR